MLLNVHNFLRTNAENVPSTSMLNRLRTAPHPLLSSAGSPEGIGGPLRRRRFWCGGFQQRLPLYMPVTVKLHSLRSRVPCVRGPFNGQRVRLYNYTMHSNRRDTISSGQKGQRCLGDVAATRGFVANRGSGGASSPRSVPHVRSFPSLYEEIKVRPLRLSLYTHMNTYTHACTHARAR